MADLFIANVSDQNHVFHWREGENVRIFNIDIPAGSQIHVLRDKPPEIVNAVIEHHKRYGLKNITELKNASYDGDELKRIYSTDGQLPMEVYALAQEINDEIRRRRVQLSKEKTAYAFAKTIEQDQSGLSEGIKEIEIEIEEQTPKEPGLKSKPLVKQKFNKKIQK
jgi:hypothetical protein